MQKYGDPGDPRHRSTCLALEAEAGEYETAIDQLVVATCPDLIEHPARLIPRSPAPRIRWWTVQ